MLSNYPDTSEILDELEQESPQGGEAQDKGGPATEGTDGAAAHGQEGVPSEPAHLDFDQYKGHHVTYKANGKEVVEPLEKVLQRASMGYDYAQKTADLKNNYIPKTELEQGYVPKDEYSKLERWKQYDDYARQNPEWAKYVEQQWNNRELVGQMDPEDPNHQLFQQFQQKMDERLSQYDQRFQSFDQFMQSQQATREDTALDEEIGQTKEKFGFMDFDRPVDESGKSVEMAVLEHMEQTGIKSFKTAFVDLYQDDILQQAESRAKEQSAKAIQQKAKKGIMGVSETPTRPQAPAARRPRTDKEAYEMALNWDGN